MRFQHSLPVGAQPIDDTQTRFRIWAPGVDELTVDIMDGDNVVESFAMEAEADGYYSCLAPVSAGSAYYYRLGDGMRVPDPAARLQQEDVHGPSIVLDPQSYAWQHPGWRGRPWQEMVIYEIHPGCWGGFKGIEERLDYLAELGITAIELMPIADFPGQRNWGYDGVLPFAPERCYGSPHELKELIDAAHARGLCIYLDVVYNHFGPDGNYLHLYAPDFFNHDSASPWGVEIDFSKRAVRDFFIHNTLYWLCEYRFDGLRFDAVHAIGEKDWLDEMAARVRRGVGDDRHVHLVLENERNRSEHLEKDFDAQWNDDGHNVLHVLLTGEHEGYYRNYVDKPVSKLARMLESGFVYQGEPSPVHGNKPRGTPSGHLPPYQFVLFLQNHDQVGNRAYGERLITLCDPLALRAAITLQLLSPQVPLLFMDEERGSTVPFLFFTDFHGELAAAVRDGRRREFQAFSAFADHDAQEKIPDPNAEETFRRSAGFRMDDSGEQVAWHRFYKDLLALRRRALVPHLATTANLEARVVGEQTVVARWRLHDSEVLCMVINLSAQDEQIEAMHGRVLFESRDGAGAAAQSGEARHYATAVFIQDNYVEDTVEQEDYIHDNFVQDRADSRE